MNGIKWLMLSVIIITMVGIALSGCGIPQSDYDALMAQKNALENEKTNLQADYDVLQTEYDSTMATYATLNSDYDTVKDELDKLKTDYQDLITQKSSLESEINEIQTEFDSVSDQLDEITSIYPPGDFPSRRALEDWLLINDVSTKPITSNAEAWIGRALEIQEDALKDGFIINVDYDYDEENEGFTVYCTTVINGYMWWWDPETDDIYEDTTLLSVK